MLVIACVMQQSHSECESFQYYLWKVVLKFQLDLGDYHEMTPILCGVMESYQKLYKQRYSLHAPKMVSTQTILQKVLSSKFFRNQELQHTESFVPFM